MKTEDRFVKYLSEVCGVGPQSFVLLAVSGGLDSMAMIHLFLSSGCKIAVGHINHGLRSVESEDDDLFVKNYCEQHQIPFFTQKIPESFWNKGNLQERARSFRYKKLNEWKIEINADFIATAHHLDDSLETFLLFFMRGTGIKGLTGISAKENHLIRPLNILTRKELEEYVTSKQISYREDSSNATDKYSRNFIRNQILPAFDKIDPKHRKGFYHTLSNIRKSEQLLSLFTEKYCSEFISYEKDFIKINSEGFKNFSHPTLLLYQFLVEFGYKEIQVEQILKNQNAGKIFLSETHILTTQLNFWTLRKIENTEEIEQVKTIEFYTFGKINIENTEWELSIIPFSDNHKSFSIHAEKLNFPLTLRPWTSSDVFRPVHMKGSAKSIKKLLSEQKIPIELRKSKMVLIDATGVVLGLEGGFVDYKNSTNVPGQPILMITKGGQKIF
ncbi:MAG: tRNA lysidine(34) synthetase TilS [Saprospiraceae bacterium]|nr:tRNA lysidine(34) synthetase TilS [Saprospiraceae bacterium]